MPPDDVPCELELIQPVQSVSGEAPLGYYVTEAVPATTRHRFVRDADGHLVGDEVEHGASKRPTGFGVS
jgi:hypothetical protein